ncbi:hypothetical protein KKC83_02490 [Patescibacteria group bacterium]|nr:hypothetical protein [Candidatus Falkowbacteria bacterium]MBU3906423.1 hypothetical protein [Patescibacteria group bacterium]MCG2697800.1 hypothetical protein [Candidatus Parcubacteria bacterium]MBU4015478.1 hypothetical protein [Patescibacteria group bacterium]MBU4026385.1 hypothetical protein [Patescibacteria group bacterium]
MTLTPEQFNLLATKQDLENLVTKDDLDKKIDKVLAAVDGIAKKFETAEIEGLSNQVAHNRFEERISILEKCKTI